MLVDEEDGDIASLGELGKGRLDGRYRCLCAEWKARESAQSRQEKRTSFGRTRIDDQEVLLASPVDVSRSRQQQSRDRVLPVSTAQSDRESEMTVQ